MRQVGRDKFYCAKVTLSPPESCVSIPTTKVFNLQSFGLHNGIVLFPFPVTRLKSHLSFLALPAFETFTDVCRKLLAFDVILCLHLLKTVNPYNSK